MITNDDDNGDDSGDTYQHYSTSDDGTVRPPRLEIQSQEIELRFVLKTGNFSQEIALNWYREDSVLT